MAQGLGQPQVLSQELVHMWSRPRLFPQEGEASPTGMHSKTLPSCLLPGQQVEPVFSVIQTVVQGLWQVAS